MPLPHIHICIYSSNLVSKHLLDKVGLHFFLSHYTTDIPDLILVIKLFYGFFGDPFQFWAFRHGHGHRNSNFCLEVRKMRDTQLCRHLQEAMQKCLISSPPGCLREKPSSCQRWQREPGETIFPKLRLAWVRSLAAENCFAHIVTTWLSSSVQTDFLRQLIQTEPDLLFGHEPGSWFKNFPDSFPCGMLFWFMFGLQQ